MSTEGSTGMWEVIRNKEVYTVHGLNKEEEGGEEGGSWRWDDRRGREGQQKKKKYTHNNLVGETTL